MPPTKTFAEKEIPKTPPNATAAEKWIVRLPLVPGGRRPGESTAIPRYVSLPEVATRRESKTYFSNYADPLVNICRERWLEQVKCAYSNVIVRMAGHHYYLEK